MPENLIADLNVAKQDILTLQKRFADIEKHATSLKEEADCLKKRVGGLQRKLAFFLSLATIIVGSQVFSHFQMNNIEDRLRTADAHSSAVMTERDVAIAKIDAEKAIVIDEIKARAPKIALDALNEEARAQIRPLQKWTRNIYYWAAKSDALDVPNAHFWQNPVPEQPPRIVANGYWQGQLLKDWEQVNLEIPDPDTRNK